MSWEKLKLRNYQEKIDFFKEKKPIKKNNRKNKLK